MAKSKWTFLSSEAPTADEAVEWVLLEVRSYEEVIDFLTAIRDKSWSEVFDTWPDFFTWAAQTKQERLNG